MTHSLWDTVPQTLVTPSLVTLCLVTLVLVTLPLVTMCPCDQYQPPGSQQSSSMYHRRTLKESTKGILIIRIILIITLTLTVTIIIISITLTITIIIISSTITSSLLIMLRGAIHGSKRGRAARLERSDPIPSCYQCT